MTTERSCGSCEFAVANPANVSLLDCRVDPPKVFVLPGANGPALNAFFPPMQKHHWCGKFELKTALKS